MDSKELLENVINAIQDQSGVLLGEQAIYKLAQVVLSTIMDGGDRAKFKEYCFNSYGVPL